LSFLELAQKVITQNGDVNSKIIKQLQGSRTKFYLDVAKLANF